MAKNNEKTNVMRILEAAKKEYNSYCYLGTGAISGEEVAAALNQNPECVFKTLVTVGKFGEHFVFVIPVKCELDLKKAAASVGEKSLSMVKQKDLLPLTGYVHGGCSPIGMKKKFKTVINHTANNFDSIIFSAGKIGYQVEVKTAELVSIIGNSFGDVVIDI